MSRETSNARSYDPEPAAERASLRVFRFNEGPMGGPLIHNRRPRFRAIRRNPDRLAIGKDSTQPHCHPPAHTMYDNGPTDVKHYRMALHK